MTREETDLKKRKSFPLRKGKRWAGLSFFGLTLAGLVIFICWLFMVVPWLKDRPLLIQVEMESSRSAEGNMPGAKELKTDIVRLQKKLDRLTPGGAYLVVNTSRNSFTLYKNGKLIRSGLCSTGSYIKLEVSDKKHYIFETPRGVLTVRGKITSPVWHKPDWAFIEEGLPVPSFNDPSRYEYGVLGDYALSLGNGYLIHGTLYKRFLGMPVTHGCIRMNDEDLEAVYKTLPVGAKVFIY